MALTHTITVFFTVIITVVPVAPSPTSHLNIEVAAAADTTTTTAATTATTTIITITTATITTITTATTATATTATTATATTTVTIIAPSTLPHAFITTTAMILESISQSLLSDGFKY